MEAKYVNGRKNRLDIELSLGEIHTCYEGIQTFWFVFKGLEVEIDNGCFEDTVAQLLRLEDDDMTYRRVKLHTELRSEIKSLLKIAELKRKLREEIQTHNLLYPSLQFPFYKMGERPGWRDDRSDTPEEIHEVACQRIKMYLNHVTKFIRQ